MSESEFEVVTMKVDCPAKELPWVGFWQQQGSLHTVLSLVKELLTSGPLNKDLNDKVSSWQLIFLQSKANGCLYSGDDLTPKNWEWPRDTWFQERLSQAADGPSEAQEKSWRVNTPMETDWLSECRTIDA